MCENFCGKNEHAIPGSVGGRVANALRQKVQSLPDANQVLIAVIAQTKQVVPIQTVN